MSNKECSPSDRFSTQSRALISLAMESPPVERYRPRRPSCGSQSGLRLRYRLLFSRTSNVVAQTRSDSARHCGLIKFKLSAEVWYSGKLPHTLLIRQPTAKLKPGEQY